MLATTWCFSCLVCQTDRTPIKKYIARDKISKATEKPILSGVFDKQYYITYLVCCKPAMYDTSCNNATTQYNLQYVVVTNVRLPIYNGRAIYMISVRLTIHSNNIVRRMCYHKMIYTNPTCTTVDWMRTRHKRSARSNHMQAICFYAKKTEVYVYMICIFLPALWA